MNAILIIRNRKNSLVVAFNVLSFCYVKDTMTSNTAREKKPFPLTPVLTNQRSGFGIRYGGPSGVMSQSC